MSEETKSTLIRVDTEAKDRLLEAGAGITHNPSPSANDALYAVLGELEKLQKRVSQFEKSLTRTPVAA